MSMTTGKRIGAGVAVAAAALLAAAAVAVATPERNADSTPSPTATSAPDSSGKVDGNGGSGETALTGSDAEKATAAAEAAVSGGTVIRVETDNDGVYEAHVRKSDGTEVVVKLDKDFNVTGIEDFAGRGGGRGGHGRGGSGETALTGSDAEKATTAAEGAVSGGTVIRVETDNDGVYEAHVTESDGTEVVVKLDKDFNVTGIEDFAGRGHGGPGSDDSAQDDSTSTATPAA